MPFFLVGGTALGLGRGEQLYALPDLGPAAVVLVQPPFGVPTADAYRWYQDEGGPATRSRSGTQVLRLSGHPSGYAVLNDLEGPVVARHPQIGQARRRLVEKGAHLALMSGSGSAVFGLFDDRQAARAAAACFDEPGWRVVVTRTLGRVGALPTPRVG